MINKRKLYTLLVDDHGVKIINRQHMLEEQLYRLKMVYEYIDELDDLIHEINQKLDALIEKAEKKNHDSSSNHDSSVQF